MMKKVLSVMLVVLTAVTMASAQSKTLLVSESGTPYAEETWFAYGDEGSIDQNDIVSCWNQGKRIISAAYTSEGWLVIMAKNTPYVMQTYSLTEAWPEEWLEAKTKEGYVVTALSRSEKEWLVVMSQGTGITRQAIWCNTWENLAPWIAEQTSRGFCITGLAFDGLFWTVVMSENSNYASQGYLWAKSTSELLSMVQTEVWGKGFNIHQVEFGADKYIVVYGNYERGDGRFQNLQVSPDEVKEYIREQWAKGIVITYAGGGLPDASKKAVPKRWVSKQK